MRSRTIDETNGTILIVGKIKMNDETHEVYYQDQLISLTQKEYELLKCFLQHPKKKYLPRQIYMKRSGKNLILGMIILLQSIFLVYVINFKRLRKQKLLKLFGV